MIADEAIDLIPPSADPRAHACATWMLRWPGVLVEDRGPNRGRALDEILNAYRSRWSLSRDTDLPWCAILASVAWAISADRYLWGRSLSEIAPTLLRPAWWSSKSPLGDWYGAVHSLESIGRARGLWSERAELAVRAPDARIVGAMLCRDRRGSGSDPISGQRLRAYPGHVDIAIAPLDEDRVLAVGGNVGNEVRIVERSLSDPRLRGAVLLPSSRR